MITETELKQKAMQVIMDALNGEDADSPCVEVALKTLDILRKGGAKSAKNSGAGGAGPSNDAGGEVELRDGDVWPEAKKRFVGSNEAKPGGRVGRVGPD